MSIVKPLLLVTLVSMTASCAQVGSKRWCGNLKEKPKSEWTFEETKQYTAHCFFSKSKNVKE